MDDNKYLGHSIIRDLSNMVGNNVKFAGEIASVKQISSNHTQIVLRPCIINEKVTIDHINIFVNGQAEKALVGAKFTSNSIVSKYRQYSKQTKTYYYNYGLSEIPNETYQRLIRQTLYPDSFDAKVDHILDFYSKGCDDLTTVISHIEGLSMNNAKRFEKELLNKRRKSFNKADKKYKRNIHRLNLIHTT